MRNLKLILLISCLCVALSLLIVMLASAQKGKIAETANNDGHIEAPAIIVSCGVRG